MDESIKEILIGLIEKFQHDNQELASETESLLRQIMDILNADTRSTNKVIEKLNESTVQTYPDQEQENLPEKDGQEPSQDLQKDQEDKKHTAKRGERQM